MGTNEYTAGIDWISGTVSRETNEHAGWYRRCWEILQAVVAEGHVAKPGALYGFCGTRAGGCFVGFNESRYYVQFSGAWATFSFCDVLAAPIHISRLDVQLTWSTDTDIGGMAAQAYEELGWRRMMATSGRKAGSALITNSDGGSTCYIGRRGGTQFGRIYDKKSQMEVDVDGSIWRYEVELRNDEANHVARYLHGQLDDLQAACFSYALIWFRKRGVSMSHLPLPGATVHPLRRVVATDIERKLLWIERQVRPTIRYLIDAGFSDKLIDILPIFAAIAAATVEPNLSILANGQDGTRYDDREDSNMTRTGTPTIIALSRTICRIYGRLGAGDLATVATPAFAAAVAALAVACNAFAALDDYPGQIDASGPRRAGEDDPSTSSPT